MSGAMSQSDVSCLVQEVFCDSRQGQQEAGWGFRGSQWIKADKGRDLQIFNSFKRRI